MKENYFEILLLVLVVVVGLQSYSLYNINNSLKDKQVTLNGYSLLIPKIRSFDGFFDNHVDPFMEMERLRQEMEGSFVNLENLFQTTPSLRQFTSKMYRIPRLDVKEKDSKYIVIMEIPGVDQATIDIKTQNGELVVSANVSEQQDDNNTAYYRHERRTSSYKRIIKLPSDVDKVSLKSDYKDGLLTVTFDKKIS